MSDELQELWQAQNPEPFRMSLEEIRRRAEKLQRRVRNRNLREIIACAIAAAVCGVQTFQNGDTIMRIGAALLVASMIVIVHQLTTRGASREITGDCLEFHRRELARQRDLLRGVWKWYLGPMVPGLLVIGLRSYFRRPTAGHAWFLAGYLLVGGIMFYWIGRMNQRAAGCLQRQIDELDELR